MNQLGKSTAPSAAVRVRGPDYTQVEELFYSTGEDLAAASTAAVSGSHILITSVYDGNVLHCSI